MTGSFAATRGRCAPGVSALSMPNGAMSSFRAQIDAYREASQ
jgi:hypothetical protein